jgi:hypothetical protein
MFNPAGPPVPARVVTVILAVPNVAVSATVRVAVICVLLTTVILLKLTPGTSADSTAPVTKLVPVSVTGMLFPIAAEEGLMPVSVTGFDSTIEKL